MTRKLGLVLSALGLVAFIGACSDDSGNKSPIYLDGGGDTGGGGGDTGGGVSDTGGGVADTGGPANGTCVDILTCIKACGTDQSCATACVGKGSADAQAKFQALGVCFDGALKGSCKTQCTNQSDPACQTCVMAACKTENDACLGGGGAPTEGFGAPCDATNTCKNGLQCEPMMSGGKGFCTKTCTNSNPAGLCPNAPTGTHSVCAFPMQSGGFVCGFICKLETTTWPCPTGLTCDSKPNPPGSSQFACVPQ